MELLGRELWLVLGGFRQCRTEIPTESMPSSVGCLLSTRLLTRDSQGILRGSLLSFGTMDALPNHFAANRAEHGKGNPMIEPAYILADGNAGGPTDHWGNCLDSAED